MRLRDWWTPPTPMAPAVMREQLAMLDAGEMFDPDAYRRELRVDRQEMVLWAASRVLVVMAIIAWGTATLSVLRSMRVVQGHASAAGSCERHASATRRPAPLAAAPRIGPVPAYQFGGAVLQLYTVSDRRSAWIEASELRTTLAQHEGQAWAVRVTVVPWWSNQWTVVVPDVLPHAAVEVCDWFSAFDRPVMPPPAPGRASGRKTCRWFGGRWPMQSPPQEDL